MDITTIIITIIMSTMITIMITTTMNTMIIIMITITTSIMITTMVIIIIMDIIITMDIITVITTVIIIRDRLIKTLNVIHIRSVRKDFAREKLKAMDHPTRLPWSQRISFGVGHALNDLCASMWFSYLIVYLQLVLGFDSNYAGFVLLIGQVADAVATPLLGMEASKKAVTGVCKRYGKRKFLHFIGTVCVILSFPFIFSVCPGCENSSQLALTTMLVPLVIIFQFGWAAVQVSHLSLIPVITPHETERDFLNVFRYAIDIASDMGTYVIVWAVFDLTRKPTGSHHTITGEYADKFMLIVLIIVGIGAFFSIIFHLGVREVPKSPISSEENSYDEKMEKSPGSSEFPPFPENLSWRGWLKEVHFYQVGLIYTATRLFQNMSSVFMPLYLSESLKANDDFIAKIPLVMNLAGFAISCLLPKLFKVFSKKVTFMAGACAGVGACVWISVGEGESFHTQGIFGVGALMGAAASMLVVSSLSFTHDLIGTSSESGAFVYGCMSFWDKMANGIAGMVVQHMHAVHCDKCDWFYRDVMAYGVGGAAMFSSLILITLLPANLGVRQSAYNGAVNSKEIVNYQALEESNEGSTTREIQEVTAEEKKE
ncbi:hypothetical protein JTE90_018285 [Oedothorax gibbosus]|uniref:Major facilitator superfamily domain-containing protein 12 n=1 Tax=Oedothorax gibbosus TaxID=931172 RepID=A0AAV6UWM2_9ARAC|nr:hypothetical protein JTE90_018285 [Oedothorax gibbosus]